MLRKAATEQELGGILGANGSISGSGRVGVWWTSWRRAGRIATGLAEETEAEFEGTQLGCSCPPHPVCLVLGAGVCGSCRREMDLAAPGSWAASDLHPGSRLEPLSIRRRNS